MTKSSCSRTSGKPSEQEKYQLQRKQQINTFQTFITVSGKMISGWIPRINKSEVLFPSKVSKNLPAGTKETQRLALTITWWVWPEVSIYPFIGGRRGAEIANQQENHSQGKYLPRRLKKYISQQIYQPIFQFSFPARNPCRTHILQTLLLGAPGTCLKFLEPLFLGFFYQSIINWC